MSARTLFFLIMSYILAHSIAHALIGAPHITGLPRIAQLEIWNWDPTGIARTLAVGLELIQWLLAMALWQYQLDGSSLADWSMLILGTAYTILTLWAVLQVIRSYRG